LEEVPAVNCRIARIRTQSRWFYEEYQLGKLVASLSVVAGIWFVAALVICSAERRYSADNGTAPERFGSLGGCLWSSTIYLVSGLEEFEPQAPLSKAAAVMVMIAGVGALGMVGARLAATFVMHAQRRGLLRRLPRARLCNHVVVCGWPERGDRLLAELRAAGGPESVLVVVDEQADTIRLPEHRKWPSVWGLVGDPSDDQVLRRAQVTVARSAVVVGKDQDTSEATKQARELLIVLALRTVAPDLHVVVPAPGNRAVRRLLARQNVELPVVNGLSSRLVAHASQKHFLTDFFERLLASGDETNSVHELPLPDHLVGLTFRDVQRRLAGHTGLDLTLVGVRHPATEGAEGGSTLAVNPERANGRHVPLAAGDRLLFLAHSVPDLSPLAGTEP